MFKTDNGVEIKPGLRVFTNDYAWGTVTDREPTNDGWFVVKIDANAKYCAGQTKLYNGERMSTREPVVR